MSSTHWRAFLELASTGVDAACIAIPVIPSATLVASFSLNEQTLLRTLLPLSPACCVVLCDVEHECIYIYIYMSAVWSGFWCGCLIYCMRHGCDTHKRRHTNRQKQTQRNNDNKYIMLAVCMHTPHIQYIHIPFRRNEWVKDFLLLAQTFARQRQLLNLKRREWW